ncbi:MAG: endonuclease/exonuclease/phosphatase family protein, partial [Prevotella sp.]|nr:endonuclease/exonuclease/phosphatase family protein [Prevotella sp.]
MTKRLSILLTLAVVFVISTTAQKKFSVYGVGFYNQENLFDTCHDNGKNDYEYLPTGANKWDGLKYVNKLRNMSRALADMGTDMLPNV